MVRRGKKKKFNDVSSGETWNSSSTGGGGDGGGGSIGGSLYNIRAINIK